MIQEWADDELDVVHIITSEIAVEGDISSFKRVLASVPPCSDGRAVFSQCIPDKQLTMLFYMLYHRTTSMSNLIY